MKMYKVEVVNAASGERLHTFTGDSEIAEIERECLVSLLLFVGAVRNFHVEIVEAKGATNNGK